LVIWHTRVPKPFDPYGVCDDIALLNDAISTTTAIRDDLVL
jgi:hypothetical protein